MSVNPYNCDDMLLESIGVFCENDELIAKLNESNKLVEKYKNLAEISLEKLKEFECLNMDLAAKLSLSNKESFVIHMFFMYAIFISVSHMMV